MLMGSPRHRAEDLALWREYEAADRLHARRLAPKIAQSLEAIRVFTRDACFASVSWGKDSVAMAHLLWLVAPHVPLVFVRPFNSMRTPERDEVRDAFLARFDCVYGEIVVQYRLDATEAENDKLFFEALRSCGARYITGIRADESGGRRIRMRAHGLATASALAPLGWWTAADVFAYLAANDLPTHAAYAMLGGGRWRRDRIRIDDLGGDRGSQFGRAGWEQEYYGDLLRRIEQRAMARAPAARAPRR